MWQGLNLEFTLLGAGVGGGDIVTQRSGHHYVAPATSSPTYDEYGNLTSDSRWTYTWDGENRLVAMESNTTALSAGVPKRRLDFLYDGQSRRISKKVMDWNAANSDWSLTQERRFVYDGWNLVAEVDGSGTLIKSHTWGLDVSQSPQGAGGVGGLLWTHDTATNQTHFMAYDGNGNVTALVKADTANTVSARYDYNAFGETLLQESDGIASSNPYRFSTKYQDEETGLYDYGYRYYSAELGRWISRDPIEEEGGLNIYGMVGNDAVNKVDYLGLQHGGPAPGSPIPPGAPLFIAGAGGELRSLLLPSDEIGRIIARDYIWGGGMFRHYRGANWTAYMTNENRFTKKFITKMRGLLSAAARKRCATLKEGESATVHWGGSAAVGNNERNNIGYNLIG